MKHKTTSPLNSGSQSGQHNDDLANEAKEAVHHVADRVKETAQEAGREVRKQAGSAVRQQQDLVAEKLGYVGEAFHDSANRLRKEDAAPFATLIDQAAEQIEHLSSYLREKELSDMFQGLQQLARRNPVMFFGGCFVAGLMISRVIKSATVGASQSSGIDSNPSYSRSSAARSSESRRGSHSASRSGGRSGLERQSSMGKQYGSSAFTPASGSAVGEGGTGSAARWEET